MDEFKSVFGIERSQVNKTCVLMPFLSAQMKKFLKVEKIYKGALFSSAICEGFTLIITRMGASFAGDCVSWLSAANIENIVFAGSCGSVCSDISIGDIVRVDKAYAMESFTEIITERTLDPLLVMLEHVIDEVNDDLLKAVSLTTASIKNENTILEKMKNKDVEIVDMESSAVISAANKYKLNAMIMLFVQDVPQKKPFYREYSQEDKAAILNAQKRICSIIWDMTKHLMTS